MICGQTAGERQGAGPATNCEEEERQNNSVLIEIIFTYTYPRLDVHSKGMNHLLKSPWCAHPKTAAFACRSTPRWPPSSTFRRANTAHGRRGARCRWKAGTVLGQGKDISATRLQKYEAADGFRAQRK